MNILYFVIIISLIILLIIFIPLPLKTIIYCSKENYYIKLFKFRIIYKKVTNVEETQKIPLNSQSSPKKKKKKKKSELFSDFPIQKVLKIINKRKYKSWLYIKGDISYSLNDSANTAIFYGIISSILPLSRRILNMLFNTKKYRIDVKPQFKDIFSYEINIESILFISIGQIINICFLILKTIIMEKVKKYEQ